MLGLVLLYVGIVLISNGVCALTDVDDKSASVIRIFTGIVSLYCNALTIISGDYYSAGTGLLFGFTYLYQAANGIFNIDRRPYAWYSLLVAIITVPAAIIAYPDDWRMAIIWILWGILWATAFIEIVLKKNLGKFVPYLAVFEGIVTALVPGFLMLINRW